MKFREDGTPISANSIANKGASKESLSPDEIHRLLKIAKMANEVHLATVREVYFVDDIKNQSKTQVEYRVRIEFGDRHGQEYESVTAMNLWGGMMNFSEIVYSPKEQITNGNEDSEEQYMFNHDGSQVVVAFMDGYPNRPFILGGWSHTNNDVFATKTVDGVRKIEEFNGMRLETNKDGEFILVYYGGKRDSKIKKTARANTAPTTFKIDKTGAWTLDDKENQEIKVDRVSKQITLTQRANVKPDETYGKTDSSAPGDVVNQITMDKALKKGILKFGKVTVTIDGTADSFVVQTTGGANAHVDGGSGTILLKDNGTGELKISGDKVALGASSAELLQQISDALQKLITFFNAEDATHVHIGNLGYPTAPPMNAAAFTAVASDLSTIKGLIDGIKGTL